jgi:hypothetical protein
MSIIWFHHHHRHHHHRGFFSLSYLFRPFYEIITIVKLILFIILFIIIIVLSVILPKKKSEPVQPTMQLTHQINSTN